MVLSRTPTRCRRECGLNSHLDVGAINLDGKGLHFDGTVSKFFAGADVVLPHVPGATDDLALQEALAQRPALMEAGVIGGVNLPSHIVEGDVLPIDGHDHGRSRLQI